MNSIVVDKSELVPSKVVCVGKNYLDHIREMGGEKPFPEPTIFMKPNSAIVSSPESVSIPEKYGTLHHEVELCFVISKQCKGATQQNASDYILGWSVGIDFTLRDIQSKAKERGGPWEISKGFDSSAVFGEFHSRDDSFNPMQLAIRLEVNDEPRQDGNTGQMIFTPTEVIEYVSGFVTLNRGDIIMMGTPKGVGPVIDGDIIHAAVSQLPSLTFKVNRP